ncbi:hypothetical protein TcYC6_0020260 [Trypanosoma cruzi]|nr:hypothetical protein TcYC6_0020260 [Trypanosoma cruzi]
MARLNVYRYAYPIQYCRLRAANGSTSNLARTMSALESPLHHEEWDGSVQTIQGDLCMLHDAVSRNTLREGFNILLRAAIVSEQEDEPLDLSCNVSLGWSHSRRWLGRRESWTTASCSSLECAIPACRKTGCASQLACWVAVVVVLLGPPLLQEGDARSLAAVAAMPQQ